MRSLTHLRMKQIRLTLDHRDISPSVKEIFDLISSQNWAKLKTILRRNSIFFQKNIIADCTGTCCHTCKSNHSILHYVCQFHPPYKIVKLLYKANPKGVYDLDCKGRYPLHIACKHGCHPNVINFLIDKNPLAVKTRDIKNRTPFLLGMKSYVQRAEVGRTTANMNLMQIARDLLKVDQETCLVEDQNGFTALEYAINEELAIDLVRFIQYKFEHVSKEIQSKEENSRDKKHHDDFLRFNFEEWCEKQNYVLPCTQMLPHCAGKSDAGQFSAVRKAPMLKLNVSYTKARAA